MTIGSNVMTASAFYVPLSSQHLDCSLKFVMMSANFSFVECRRVTMQVT